MPRRMSLVQYIHHFEVMAPSRVKVFTHDAVEEIAAAAAQRAREKLGTYQDAVGPYQAWAPLAESTIERHGGEDTPLLLTGELRDSIGHGPTVQTARGSSTSSVWSTAEYAIYQELGTSHHPARPFIGPAIFETVHKHANDLGYGVEDAINPDAAFSHFKFTGK